MESVAEQDQVLGSAGEPRLVRKPVELICCAPGQSLSFTQRRIITAICDAASQFQDTDVVCFSPRELSLALYNGGENLRELHKASTAMRDLKAWLNPLDERSAPETAGVFEEIACTSSEILYRLNPKISQLIRSGECFAEVDPVVEKKLAAANAVALYELAVLFLRRHERPSFGTARWRQLITGSSTKENQRFVTSQIMVRAAASLERCARISPAVARPRGPRVDLVRLEFKRLSGPIPGEAAHETPLADARGDADSPAQGNGERAAVRHLNGVDAFEQLLDSWNSQFGATGRHAEGPQGASGSSRDSPARDDAEPKLEPGPEQWGDVVAAWEAARGETGRIKQQLQDAERLERDAALRALRVAVLRYQATPEEVFGANAQRAEVAARGARIAGAQPIGGHDSFGLPLGQS